MLYVGFDLFFSSDLKKKAKPLRSVHLVLLVAPEGYEALITAPGLPATAAPGCLAARRTQGCSSCRVKLGR